MKSCEVKNKNKEKYFQHYQSRTNTSFYLVGHHKFFQSEITSEFNKVRLRESISPVQRLSICIFSSASLIKCSLIFMCFYLALIMGFSDIFLVDWLPLYILSFLSTNPQSLASWFKLIASFAQWVNDIYSSSHEERAPYLFSIPSLQLHLHR